MPVERRDIGSTIGPGNFGSRGVPLGFTPQKKGPDLGRLVNALGVGLKAVSDSADEGERKVATEAELATRKAWAENASIRPGESPMEHKDRINSAVAAVRTKYEERDRGWKAELTHAENTSLQAVDRVQTEKRAHRVRNEISLLRKNNPGLTTEEYMTQVDKLMEDGFLSIDHVSKEDKVRYLKEVNTHALNEIGAMTQMGEAVRRETALKDSASSSFGITVDKLGTRLGVSVDQANDSIEHFDNFHTNYDKVSKQVNSDVSDNAQDVYNKALAISNGNKQQAMDEALKYTISVAKATGRPDIIDAVAKRSLNKDGTNLSRFHSKQLFAAKEQIEAQRERTRRSLVQEQHDSFVAGNTKQYNSTKLEVGSQVDMALNNPDNVDEIRNAEKKVQEHMEQVYNDFSEGKYRGNEAQANRMLDYLRTARKTMARTTGTAEGNEMLLEGMASSNWTKRDHYKWVDKLSPENKQLSWDLIQDELSLDKQMIQTNQQIAATEKHMHAVKAQGETLGKFTARASKDKAFIAAMASEDTQGAFGNLEPINIPSPQEYAASYNSEFKFNMLQLQKKINAESKANGEPVRFPTIEEQQEVLENLDKKYDKMFQDSQSVIDSYRNEQHRQSGIKDIIEGESQVEDGEIKRGADISNPGQIIPKDQVPVRVERINEAIEEARSGTINAGNTGQIYEGYDLGLATEDDVKTALIVDTRHKNFKTPSEFMEYVSERVALDLTDPSAKTFLKEVLRRGFEKQGILKRRISNSILEERPEDFTKRGGRGSHLYTVGGESSSNQLGDKTMGKIMEAALEDSQLLTRPGLTKFLDQYPFNTWPNANNEDMTEQEVEAERIKLRDEEVERMMKVLTKMKKNSK